MHSFGRTMVDLPAEATHVTEALSLIFVGGIAELAIVWVNGGVTMTQDQLSETCVQFMLSNLETIQATTARITGSDTEQP